MWPRTKQAPAASAAEAIKLLELGSTKDAMDMLLRLALSDDPEAQYWLGDINEFALRNLGEAAKWYGCAAQNGHRKAQWCLANLYMVGKGVSQNRSEAARWYRQAADQGVPEAQFMMGELLRVGDVLTRDIDGARHWYRRSHQSGFKLAAARLQQMDQSSGTQRG